MGPSNNDNSGHDFQDLIGDLYDSRSYERDEEDSRRDEDE